MPSCYQRSNKMPPDRCRVLKTIVERVNCISLVREVQKQHRSLNLKLAYLQTVGTQVMPRLKGGDVILPAQFSLCEDLEVADSEPLPSSDSEAHDLNHLS
ncbi:hypothetical protein STEG23_008519 [Scotinomys teguina]